jgi:phosphoglucosamine mutase
MNTLFGTDGIRGRTFEPPLDEATVRRLGAALAADLGEAGPPRILIAGDTRASTDVLADWLASSFRAGGGEVVWAGVLPTPAVSALMRDIGGAAGVVVSASHNPADDNGIKVLGPAGEKLADHRERHLEERLPETEPLNGPGPAAGGPRARRALPRAAGSHHRRPGPCPACTSWSTPPTARPPASPGTLMRRLGARVTPIASAPDGRNINLECGATAPARLAAAVVELGADAGVALDGDADRAMLVDERGAVLDGDDILLAWARSSTPPAACPGGRVVATVMSNFGLERALAARGLETVRCPVGDRSVWLAMQEHGAALGGEQSGTSSAPTTGSPATASSPAPTCWRSPSPGRVPVSALSGLERLPQLLVNVPVARKRRPSKACRGSPTSSPGPTSAWRGGAGCCCATRAPSPWPGHDRGRGRGRDRGPRQRPRRRHPRGSWGEVVPRSNVERSNVRTLGSSGYP